MLRPRGTVPQPCIGPWRKPRCVRTGDASRVDGVAPRSTPAETHAGRQLAPICSLVAPRECGRRAALGATAGFHHGPLAAGRDGSSGLRCRADLDANPGRAACRASQAYDLTGSTRCGRPAGQVLVISRRHGPVPENEPFVSESRFASTGRLTMNRWNSPVVRRPARHRRRRRSRSGADRGHGPRRGALQHPARRHERPAGALRLSAAAGPAGRTPHRVRRAPRRGGPEPADRRRRAERHVGGRRHGSGGSVYLAHIPGHRRRERRPDGAGVRGDRLPEGVAGRFYLLRSNGNRSHEVWDVTDPRRPRVRTDGGRDGPDARR